MAKCEKCSAEIADGLTLCDNCKQGTASLWARPGAVANSGNSYVKPVSDEPVVAETAKTEPVSDAVDEPVAADEPAAAGSELDRRVKQTEYFNAVANVEQEQELPDVDDIYPPTSLLEVPFRDTEYNLGYTIPKMKMVVSKKSRRKFLFGSLIVSAVAVLVAGFIMLESIFGFLPRVVDTPVLYVKAGNLYLTGTGGKRPQHFAYDGNAFQVANNAQKIRFSPFNDDVFVVKNHNSKFNTYDLYIRRDREVSGQGSLIDSSVCGDFEYVQKGKALLYMKGTSSNKDLYLYNIDKAESTRVVYSIDSFALLDEKNVVFLTRNGDIKKVDITAKASEAVTEIVQDVDGAYFDEDVCNSFFYVKSLRNTETDKMESDLYRYENGKTDKVATNVTGLVSYNCAENWAYVTGDNNYTLTVGELIDDDCEKNDRDSTAGVHWGPDISLEMVAMIKRNTLRDRAFSEKIPFTSFSLSYYSKGKCEVVTDYCTEVTYVGERQDSGRFEYSVENPGAAIVYKCYEPGQKVLTFSQLTDDMLNYTTFVSHVKELARPVTGNTQYGAAVKGVSAKLTYSYINPKQISFNKKYDALYYVDFADKEAEKGDLMQLKITEKGFGNPEPVAVDATDFYLLADGTVLYVDDDKTIYAGSEALAHRTSGYTVNKARNAVAIMAETIDTGSRLVIFKDRTKKAIAESVKAVAFNDDNTISFIKDYDKVAGGGDYYICKNFNTISRIDTGVSGVIKLKY